MIIGDFNSDPYRSSAFDNILTSAVIKNNLQMADLLYLQNVNYTYKLLNKSSRIDHVITNTTDLTLNQINILIDDDNLSDHLCVSKIRRREPLKIKISDQINNIKQKNISFRIAYDELLSLKLHEIELKYDLNQHLSKDSLKLS